MTADKFHRINDVIEYLNRGFFNNWQNFSKTLITTTAVSNESNTLYNPINLSINIAALQVAIALLTQNWSLIGRLFIYNQ